MWTDPDRYTDQKGYLKDIYKGKYLGEGHVFAKKNPLSKVGE